MSFFREVLGGEKVACRVCGAANSAGDAKCFNCRSALAPAPPPQPSATPARANESRVLVSGADHMVEAARTAERNSREPRPPKVAPAPATARTAPPPAPAPPPLVHRQPSPFSTDPNIPPSRIEPEPRVAPLPAPREPSRVPNWQDQYGSAPAMPAPPELPPAPRREPPPMAAPTASAAKPVPSIVEGPSVGRLVPFVIISIVAMFVSRVPCFGMMALGFFGAAIVTQFSARLDTSKKMEGLGYACLVLAFIFFVFVR